MNCDTKIYKKNQNINYLLSSYLFQIIFPKGIEKVSPHLIYTDRLTHLRFIYAAVCAVFVQVSSLQIFTGNTHFETRQYGTMGNRFDIWVFIFYKTSTQHNTLSTNKAFVRTLKLQQIQALLFPSEGFPKLYMKHVVIKHCWIQHLTQFLAQNLTRPLTQPFT